MDFIYLTKRIFIILITFFTLLSCLKDEHYDRAKAEDINLVFNTFVLEKKNNPYLNEDIVFYIKNDTINAELKTYFFNSIPTFSTNAKTIEIDGVEQVSSNSSVNFRKPITYKLKSESGKFKVYTVNISWDDALAHIYIDSEGGMPIISKDNYLYTKLSINGQSKYKSKIFELNQNSRIKGRGNSSWNKPKKPFKIKLDNKEVLLSNNDSLSRLLPEKDWVLLSDYQDGTHLLHNVAFTIGRMLKMPFTNTIIPVELTLNGDYLGLYGLTEQIEVKKNRVNIGKTGVLLEIDQYFDKKWQFRSKTYNLPITIKDPDLEYKTELDLIQNEWNTFEALVNNKSFPNNNYLELIDGESIAKYFIVYMLTLNEEINHPKSTYIHKEAGGKYVMGPIWDFDWAYGYEGNSQHFSNVNKDLFWTEQLILKKKSVGTPFFKRLMLSDPKVKSLIKKYWAEFITVHFGNLMTHIDEQAFIIKGAKSRNLEKWNTDLVNDELLMKQWIQDRVLFMNNFISEL